MVRSTRYICFGDSSGPRVPDHGSVRRPAGNETHPHLPDLKAQAAVPAHVALRHGLQVAELTHLLGLSQDRLEEPRTDAAPLCRRIDAHHFEVPVRLAGMQLRYAGRVPKKPTRRAGSSARARSCRAAESGNAPSGSQTATPTSSSPVEPLTSRMAA